MPGELLLQHLADLLRGADRDGVERLRPPCCVRVGERELCPGPGPYPGLYVWINCAWNLAGALLLLPWAAPMSTLQAGVTVLSILVATVVYLCQ